MEKRRTKKEVVIIGAGITGLTTTFRLQQAGWKVTLLEKSNRIGGQIETHKQKGFLFESGPNTGVVSYPEVAELFADVQLPLTTATPLANNRWIWRKKKFYALPSSLISAITTPLFTWKDKFGILAEPFRKPGTNPDETLAELVKRRMGKSYLKYAIDPFISGIYAGDVTKLVTRYALPKLYNLEQEYGSFIGGAIKKRRIPKTKRDLLATKECFSAPNGLQDLTDALAQQIGKENIQCGANDICIEPNTNNTFTIRYQMEQGAVELTTDKVITTVGAYALPALLPFISSQKMAPIAQLEYAPVVQVAVGFKDIKGHEQRAFGGLVPSHAKRKVLGILFPSSCFAERAPQNGALFSFFIGGTRYPAICEESDKAIEKLVRKELHKMLQLPKELVPDLIQIFRHEKAIPQYHVSSGARFEAIHAIEQEYTGLILGGNMCGGIGLPDRIKQGCQMAERLKETD